MGDPGLRVLAAGDGARLLLLGDVRTVKVAGADSGGELTIVEQVAEPGAASALHRHPYQEVFYVLEGELEFAGLADGERATFTAASGATVHAAAGVAHGYRNAGTEPARFLAIMQPAGAEGFFADVGVWLNGDDEPASDRSALSPDAVREAAARHGIEFLAGA